MSTKPVKLSGEAERLWFLDWDCRIPFGELKPEHARCRQCAFYVAATNRREDGAGTCQRNAPAPITVLNAGDFVAVNNAVVAVWPIVSEDAWCGEYRYFGGFDSEGQEEPFTVKRPVD